MVLELAFLTSHHVLPILPPKCLLRPPSSQLLCHCPIPHYSLFLPGHVNNLTGLLNSIPVVLHLVFHTVAGVWSLEEIRSCKSTTVTNPSICPGLFHFVTDNTTSFSLWQTGMVGHPKLCSKAALIKAKMRWSL